MRLPSCTIDTSCIIALDLLDLLPKLNFLFDQVLVPRAVRAEMRRPRRGRKRLQTLFEDYEFFRRCDEYDQASVDILRTGKRRFSTRHLGEAEAVVQANILDATVIVDDRGAGRWPPNTVSITTALCGFCGGWLS